MDLSLAKALALDLMEQHITKKLFVWTFKFDSAKRRFGLCSYRRLTISLSKALTLVNDEAQVRDTILHEIAHVNAGPNHGHDKVWVAEALRLGCNGKACFDTQEVAMPVSPWMGCCPVCKYTIRRWRRPPARSQGCGRCSPYRYDPRFQIQWSRTMSTQVVP